MKTIAIFSSKGGVGKTAAAVNLSYCASREENTRVLLCDMDAQGASTYYFRIRPKKSFNSKKLMGGKLAKYIRATDYDNLDLLPAHFSFRNLDLALAKLEGNARREALRKLFLPLAADYDVIIMDCPPNLTLLSENIILAADSVVTPVIPTTLSVVALTQLLKLFKKVGVSPDRVSGFFSMVDNRKTMHRDIILKYQKYDLFNKTMIPYLAEVEKMGLHRQPVAAVSNTSTAARQYQKLWHEIRDRSEVK